MTGYTKLQAERLMKKIDQHADESIDRMRAMTKLVTDTHNRGDYLADQIRSHALELKDVVRRRTR